VTGKNGHFFSRRNYGTKTILLTIRKLTPRWSRNGYVAFNLNIHGSDILLFIVSEVFFFEDPFWLFP
jgi:hypothetical protein